MTRGGVEPLILTLKGWHPKPLDERAKDIQQSINNFTNITKYIPNIFFIRNKTRANYPTLCLLFS